ncbi:spore germination protein [Bacillus thuringiensis]|uniref:Spore germination protein n=2 Tax=Bacillus thuringiensis TaxID=1428 RepID=A0A9W3TBF8_BACTU|nr:spore germination protein [Bacillus thuringiensis]AQY38393.1 spore germination protein [Bacillus thuringiensis]MDR4150718.1 spore germination protein [Bacillus thuringiensis]MEC3572219.1 spore germination protein [Bacillus thuringiensis]MED2017919.1 spore germination protein [Bacillus thuringiensis]MED2145639.1 spore germination protein [Bacillus thuringiensis]
MSLPFNKKNIETIQTNNLQEIKNRVQIFFNISADLIEHPIRLKNKTNALLYYFEGLTDGVSLKNNVITPLLQELYENEEIFNSIVITAYTKIIYRWDEVREGLLEGQCVLFVEKENRALLINTKGWAEREIQEPVSEVTIKGSHDGFIENVSKNIGLIRRYIPSNELKVKKLTIGARATTSVYLLYLGDVANLDIIKEMENRINKVKTDTVLSIGELSNLTKNENWTSFPLVYISERPDSISRHILDGKVAVLIDRSPSAMVISMNLIGFFQTPDDYNIHWLIASAFRLLRFFGFITAILLPALYIAIVSFHFETLPLNLYISIATSRIKVPFSPLLEAFLMEITLEMLREAGIRLPQPIGQTIGIVGGIVIGQAAVQAGLVSNIMVIIVSITAIASFIVSNYDLSNCIRLIRFPMMLFAYFFGIVGIISGIMILLAHFATLTSYGSPYGLPIAPFRLSDLKDSFIKFPTVSLTNRSSVGKSKQQKRKKDDSY